MVSMFLIEAGDSIHSNMVRALSIHGSSRQRVCCYIHRCWLYQDWCGQVDGKYSFYLLKQLLQDLRLFSSPFLSNYMKIVWLNTVGGYAIWGELITSICAREERERSWQSCRGPEVRTADQDWTTQDMIIYLLINYNTMLYGTGRSCSPLKSTIETNWR